MMKMEECMEGLDEWRDNSVSKSLADISSGGEGNLDANDHVNDVEKSTFSVVKESPLDGYGDSNELNGLRKGGESIAERRARKCGFNAAKISTPRFRTNSSLPSPCSQSPYLTIPAGISPHLLLDSPILLPNAQLSPTTGTFAAPSFDRDSQMMIPSLPGDADYTCDGSLSSMFNAHTDITSLASFSDVQNQHLVAQGDHQPLTSMEQQVNFKIPVGLSNERSMNSCNSSLPPDRRFSDDPTLNSNSSTLPPFGTDLLVSSQVSVKNETFMQTDLGSRYSSEEDQKERFSPAGSARTTEDGFNWRKYGQKQVKGSEYPRSYYKCTHPTCEVKKKVERSLDGQITEIIYKNTHNHPQPQPCRRSPFAAIPLNETSDAGFDSSTSAKAESSSAWTNTQQDVTLRGDWQTDGLERLSSASGVTEISDLPEKTSLSVLESTGTPEFSSTLANYDDDEEDASTQGNLLLVDDEDKEPDPKRRNIDTTLGSRAVRAPRVVVQIESEVDILDDGYRWRKYGQKVVKGNPNPRSYYKCTSAGCNVRKHVERAAHDLRYVITTYEGKHNHEVPAARNSSHANSGAGSLPTSAPDTNSNLPLSQNSLPKPEPHGQDLPPAFDPRMGYNTDYLRSNFLGAGAPPLFQVGYPSLPNTTPYSQYGLTSHHPGYTSGIMPTMTDLSLPMSVGFHHSATNYSNPERMISSFQPMYAGQQLADTNVKPIRPKQEQGDEPLYAINMQNANYYDSSSSMYNNMMGTFPS